MVEGGENIVPPNNLLFSFKDAIQGHQAEAFLKQKYEQHKFQVEEIKVKYWLPKGERKDIDYEEMYQNSVKRNLNIFGSLPTTLEFVAAATTEDFNKYLSFWKSKFTPKVKGDFFSGTTIRGDKILTFNWNGYAAETRGGINQATGTEEQKKLAYIAPVTHEGAHLGTIYLLRNRKVTSADVPKWFLEGLAYTVAHQSDTQEMIQELRNKLSEIEGTPSNMQIDKLYTKDNVPLVFTFGDQFIRWLFLNKTTENLPLFPYEKPAISVYDDRRTKLLVDVIKKIGTGASFDKSFQDVFELSYQDTYTQFYQDITKY